MTQHASPEVVWQKSSFSGNQGPECVEVAAVPGHIWVRESESPDVILRASRDRLGKLLVAVKRGDCDGVGS
ncbi:DUF397 domain-containing protein [Streptomyces sp. 549]|uniref:DUF397 domain-containing protein n=1 Tax=Streptomyces sp. 549 TaxID=3049076 RepID=UPI0024C432FE|nr:DUF397 domain-containing protein [Streptomyces sp. 549]MDK1474846.1 DUF397 domain-containing protein [Streptomyces sp. 549]